MSNSRHVTATVSVSAQGPRLLPCQCPFVGFSDPLEDGQEGPVP